MPQDHPPPAAQPRDATSLFGRQREQATLEQAIAAARLGSSRVVVVSGEPGIGKTALLDWAAERGRSEGMEILSARGVEDEAEIPFGGLLQLLRPALGEIERIPRGQAEALRGALDVGPTAEPDRFLIGAATLNLLSARSERAPLLVLVDDAHWLDDSSLAAVLFAARRLLVDPVAVAFAARTGESSTLAGARLPELPLAGLDSAAAAQILARHAAAPPPPGAVQRLGEATGGNPLALVELATNATGLGAEPPEGPLGLRTSVEDAYAERIGELPSAARRALGIAAAEHSGRLAWIEAAANGLGVELADLQPGEHAGLVSIAFGALSWRHPLVRSAAYRAVSPDERRAAHAALARALPDSEADRRAWHLAAAALGPDGDVAAALDQAARRARSRGAYAGAATAAERAGQLTPSDAARAQRLFTAAEAAWLGGDAQRALRDLDEALALPGEPRLRAEIEHLRGVLAIRAGDPMAGHELLIGAAAAIEQADPGKAVVMLAEATDACVYAGRPAAMLAPARRAYELLPADAGERERFFANLALGTALISNGAGDEGAERLRAALTVLEDSDLLSGDPRMLAAAALGPLWLREVQANASPVDPAIDVARGTGALGAQTSASLIDRAIELARGTGALGALPFALMLAARDAATSDRWAIGRALYEEAVALARETDQAMPLSGALAGLASLLARQGDADACAATADEALRLAKRHGLGLFHVWALDALADLELAQGRTDRALERLEDKQRTLAELGLTDPDLSPTPELVETSVRGGEVKGLSDAVDAFAAAAQAKGQPWALARLARSRGLLAEPDEADECFAEALRCHAATPDRFEEAHTRLCWGERLRRAGQRVRAREQLRPALEVFDDLGAAPWAERARSELLASGERARRRDPSTLDDLTPQELQIGITLAGGLTTRETAAKLFLSPKTVEYHLRNVYRKLGIHSREELAQALAGHD